MSKILAFDYGTVRTGIAITDESKKISFPMDVINSVELFDYLDNLLKEEDIELFVIGMPKKMNGKCSENEVHIREFITKLKVRYKVPFVRFDERFTSKIAFETIVASGVSKKKRKDKKIVDKISATLILRGYLSSISGNGK